MKAIQAIRGMNDILPQDIPFWQHLEATTRAVLESYGYEEIRTPILEKTELFSRSIGEVTDIVEKEMYSFEDRNGDSLSLRPEYTASCVRAGVEHGLLFNAIRRLWYAGPMFRHERPQKGRYRQFYQIGAEAFGLAGPETDAELILLTARLWKRLGIDGLRLEINSLGSATARAAHRQNLVAYLQQHIDELDKDSHRRLKTNPLRILDSKNPAMQALVDKAPRLIDYLDDASRTHFKTVEQILQTAGIDFTVNPRLVRGLDYYNHTVFEWITDRLGAQGTVCGGGRYDGLVAQIGGKATPGVGFSLGCERVIALLQESDTRISHRAPDAYLIAVGEEAARAAHPLAEALRDALPKLHLIVDAGAGSFKAKMKRADRSTAKLALVLGDDEMSHQRIAIKPLRSGEAQRSVAQQALAEQLKTLI